MNITPAELLAEYERAASAWPFIDDVEQQNGLPDRLLYAVGSRETNLTNVVGDGGHGHGVWQLDDRSHTIPADFEADVARQARYAAGMLRLLIDHFHGNTAAALAAYNAGAGTVDYNLAHGLSVDTGTANGDYAADTLDRLHWLQENTMATAQEIAAAILGTPVTQEDLTGHPVRQSFAAWLTMADLFAREALREVQALRTEVAQLRQQIAAQP